MNISDHVRDHYGTGGLRSRIQAGIDELGAPVTTSTLGPLDEFHTGGRSATTRLVGRLGIDSDSQVLDLGSGLGGPARHITESTGATVTGIDLTEEFVDVARWLTELVGLDDSVAFEAASATELPFEAATFDRAVMLHVGMNIEDKMALCAGVADVLRPGGRFGIYDVMAASPSEDGEFAFPVPWATDATTSFVVSPDAYVTCLEAAGFRVDDVADQTEAALAFFGSMAGGASSGPPPLGLHLVMGPEMPMKVANMVANFRAGRIAPVEIIATLPS